MTEFYKTNEIRISSAEWAEVGWSSTSSLPVAHSVLMVNWSPGWAGRFQKFRLYYSYNKSWWLCSDDESTGLTPWTRLLLEVSLSPHVVTLTEDSNEASVASRLSHVHTPTFSCANVQTTHQKLVLFTLLLSCIHCEASWKLLLLLPACAFTPVPTEMNKDADLSAVV